MGPGGWFLKCCASSGLGSVGLITYIQKVIFALFPPNSYELKSSGRKSSHFLDVWLIMLWLGGCENRGPGYEMWWCIWIGWRWRRERLGHRPSLACGSPQRDGRWGAGGVGPPNRRTPPATQRCWKTSSHIHPSHSQKMFKVQIYSPQTTEGVSHIHLV